MNYFLKDAARFLLENNKGVFSETLIIFPNRRAHLFFEKFLSELISTPVWSPGMITITDFIRGISGLQLADPLTLLFRLFDVYRKVTSSTESFDNFYYYCETILSDFDDIDKYRIDAKMLYRNLSDLKAIEDYYEYLTDFQMETIRRFWETFSTSKESGEKDSFMHLWQVMSQIYTDFNKLLDEESIAYEGKVYRTAVDKLISYEQLPFADKFLVFVGFNALNRSEEIIFDTYRKRGNTMFFWDFDEDYVQSDIHEAGYFLRHYLKRFPPPADFKSPAGDRSGEMDITSVAVPSNISQAKALDFCFKILKIEDAGNPTETVIVLADENMLLPVINSIPSSIPNINISMGYPADETPAYSFISIIADLHINKKQARGHGNLFYHKNFFSLMNHPYMLQIRNKEIYRQFECSAIKKNSLYINPSHVGIQDSLYDKIFTPIENTGSFGSYLAGILLMVAKGMLSSSAGNRENQWHLEILHGIYKVLIRYEDLLKETNLNLSLRTIIGLLRRIIKGIRIPFAGEPLKGLQVMGILETRTLDFKNIIILSMNEGKFPKPGNQNTLIPFSLREGFDLPTIRHQDAIYAYYFYRLLHRSEKIVLVHNTRSEGIQKGEASRFLLQLQYNSPAAIKELNLDYRIKPFPVRNIWVENSVKTKEQLIKYIVPEKDKYLSPSALNTYLDCKLKFFFRYVENMQEKETIEEDVEANVLGSILHKVMHTLYKPFENKVLTREDINRILAKEATIRQSIEQAFRTEFAGDFNSDENLPGGRNLIILKVIEKYVRSILRYDLESSPFKILALEKKFTCEIPLSEKRSKLVLGGIIDRLDEREGVIRVIDYKSGKIDLNFSGIEDVFKSDPLHRNRSVFQVFLYCWMLIQQGYKNVTPALFFVRDMYRKDFDYHIQNKADGKNIYVNDFSSYADEYAKYLVGLTRDIFESDTAYVQTECKKYCEKCSYNAICRRF